MNPIHALITLLALTPSDEKVSAKVVAESAIIPIIYVDADASTGGNGRTWATAYKYLQDALTEARTLNRQIEIWVADGMYYPDDDEGGNFTNDDRNSSFMMINDVAILGGFKGNENQLSKRNWNDNITILSGDLNQVGSSKSYNIINNTFTSVTALNNTSILDGFIVEDGSHNSSASTLGGGAMFNVYASVLVRNCIIRSNNASSSNGGAIFSDRSDPIFQNCLFYGNSSFFDNGHVMCNSRSNPSLLNCTLSGNTAGLGDVGIYNSSNTDITIQNSILWDNDTEITNVGSSTATVSHIIVQGGFSGTNVIDDDPLFVSPISDDYELTECSPAIESGNNSLITRTEDLNHNDRIFKSTVDMGCFEFNEVRIIYVDSTQVFNNNHGGTWGFAFDHLQDALDDVPSCLTGFIEIWVAKGTYFPDDGLNVNQGDRDEHFVMLNNVSIYGGFEGDEDFLNERDWESNITILSADIDHNDQQTPTSNNSRHVIYNSNSISEPLTYAAMIDGFTITAGYGDGGSGNGGGIYNFHSSPTIQNCRFHNNQSLFAGGALFSKNSSSHINNCVFENNKCSSLGGAMALADFSTLLIENCQFISNAADSVNFSIGQFSGEGGAIYYAGSQDSLVIKNSLFLNNNAFIRGGGLSLKSYAKLEYCHIEGNHARDGGGIYSDSDSISILSSSIDSNISNTPYYLPAPIGGGGGVQLYNGKASFINTTFTKNITPTYGGAVLSRRSSPTFVNCIFEENYAALQNANQLNFQRGAGLYMDESGTLTMDRCVFKENISDDVGGGLYITDIAEIDIVNSLFYDNRIHSIVLAGSVTGTIVNSTFTKTYDNPFNGNVNLGGGSQIDVYNSIFYGFNIDVTDNGSSILLNCLVEGGHNNGFNIIDLDPEFTDPTNFDFTLKACSPAIDTGNHSIMLTSIDLNGVTRIHDAKSDSNNPIIDLGAFEFQSLYTASCCPVHLNLTGNIGSGIYEASSSITCNGTILAGADVTLSAPDSILLTNNFNVITTGLLQLDNTGCN